MAHKGEVKTAYVCKKLWDSKDWASLELYPTPEALAPDHDQCGVIEVRVIVDRVVRFPQMQDAAK